jgi:2-polyprenyl-3-methyl-5-hydroxy-6-metoxy-1,4-benzoquinol methylase
MEYSFQSFNYCEMCHDSVDSHKVIGIRLNQSQGFKPTRKKGVAVTVFKCSNCGLIYPNPMPIPKDINDHYGIDPNAYWPENYFKVEENYMKNELTTLGELISIQPGMKALDVGAGIGKSIIAMRNKGFDAYGIEPSKTFYSYAISKMNISPDHIFCKSIQEANFEPESFDFITLSNVVEHVYDPFDTIAKAVKWLKPGGHIHIEVPSAKCLISGIINTYYKVIGTNYVTNISPMHSPFHVYEFTRRSFELAVKKMNASIVKTQTLTGSGVGIPLGNSALLKTVMRMTGRGVDLIVWITK